MFWSQSHGHAESVRVSHMSNGCCIEGRFFGPSVVIRLTTKGTESLRKLENHNSPKGNHFFFFFWLG